MIVGTLRQHLLLTICMNMYMGVSASNEVARYTRDIFNELGINQDQFTSAVETTSRAIHSWELIDVVSAGSQFLQLWTEVNQAKYKSTSSEARQHDGGYGYGKMSDPLFGFVILGGIVFAALVSRLAYILVSPPAAAAGGAPRRKRDLTYNAMSALSPDTTAYILNCIANAENYFTCLACIAVTGSGSKC